MRIDVEVTDTFGGEANYSWVRHYSFAVPDLLSNYSIIRRVKKYIQWSGERCVVTWYGGDMAGLAEIRRANACMVAFVTVGENPN